MKYTAFGKNAAIIATADTMENLEKVLTAKNRKNYLICNEDGETVKAVENGKTLKGKAAKAFEIEFTID